MDFLKFKTITFKTKMTCVSVGASHILALSEQNQAFSWGSGSRGQLGHGDFKDHKHPKHISSIFSESRKILAVGHTSLILDEFNTIRTFGCNRQGQLGANSDMDCRNTPDKIGKQFLLDDILMFKGHYDEHRNRHTLSFMNSESEIFVWGCFDIPLTGSSQKDGDEIIRMPKPMNFLFNKCLKMKIKSYEIDST